MAAAVGFAAAAVLANRDELKDLLEPRAFAFAVVFSSAFIGTQASTDDITGRASHTLDERERTDGDRAHRIAYRVAVSAASVAVAFVLVRARDATPVTVDGGLAATAISTLALIGALPTLVVAWSQPGEPEPTTSVSAERRRDTALALVAIALVALSLVVDPGRAVVVGLLIATFAIALASSFRQRRVAR